MLELGTQAPDFSLPAPRTGATVTRNEVAADRPLVVAFWCNHCPFVQHIRDAFVAVAAEVQERGVGVVAISANDVEAYPQDGPDAMAREAEEAGYTFPYLFDESQEVAKAFRAACTPDFYLFDADGRLVYRGQFDDARPGNDRPVTGADLRAAVDAVLAGRTPDPDAQVPSVGCNIKWTPGNAPEYSGG
jgi:peroxiredoxin